MVGKIRSKRAKKLVRWHDNYVVFVTPEAKALGWGDRTIEVKQVPTREQLQRFCAVLQTPRDRALFLMFATTGLRRKEVHSLTLGNIDFERRTVIPKSACGRTKNTWASFFNRGGASIKGIPQRA